MRILGILGGLGPESTIDYYRLIIAGVRRKSPEAEYPHILINSLDVDKAIAMLDSGRLDDLADYIAQGIEVLARAGAELGCIAANTPHLVFNVVQPRSPIPLVSIVQAAADHVHSLGFRKVGLLGTGFTMSARFYPDEFLRRGIELVTPTESERGYIHQKYIGELLNNEFLPETRTQILRIALRLQQEDNAQAILLAGTELPLLLRDCAPGVPLLDTAIIHVEAIVKALLARP